MGSREERLDLAWDLVEQGDHEGAWRAAERLLEEEPDDVEALVLAGSALMEAGRKEEAEERLRRALSLDPADHHARLTLASLLYDTCRFEEGLSAARAAAEADRGNAYARHLTGLLLDMSGRTAEADAAFGEAARLDPEGFPRTPVFDRRQFDAVVGEALAGLPHEFRGRLDNLTVVVEDVPSAALLETLEDPEPDLLGLFVGTPLPDRSASVPAPLPDAIYLFKRNLERACASRPELVEEIRVTLLHEIGHYLGMTEEDLEAAGYE